MNTKTSAGICASHADRVVVAFFLLFLYMGSLLNQTDSLHFHWAWTPLISLGLGYLVYPVVNLLPARARRWLAIGGGQTAVR